MFAHAGQPLQPHDVWWAWNADPLVLVPVGAAALAYRSGWRPGIDTLTRRAAFWSGLGALTVALISPIHAMAELTVSGHMVQHIVLILVAAPSLAVSAPGAALLRGTPVGVRDAARGARRALGVDTTQLRRLRSPVARWLAYTLTLWIWHASVVYGAAVDNDLLHGLQHATFFATAFLVWSIIIGPPRVRVSRGLALLGVFTLGLQGVFLSALITFAGEPYYAQYLAPPDSWHLDPLTDQQLAGVLMWVPAGFIHTGIALWLLVTWIRENDEEIEPRSARQPR